nr:transposase, Ptta/En/Spm [Tanacetum cinerariifolium]
MPSRRHNGVSSRARNNSHQSEYVTEVVSNQPNNPQVPVPRNVRKRVRGPTMMPKVWTKTEEDRISVQFNEYGQPVKDTTSTLTHFIGSLARKMYGLGVRAFDVWGVVPSHSARHRDKLQWKSTSEQLSIDLAEYKEREAQRQGPSDNNYDGTNVP